MDAEAAALLTTAGTTVVALMATDAWKQIRDGLENAVILTVDYRRVGPPVVVDTPGTCGCAGGRLLRHHH
jgi:hypothetical protein